MRKCSKCNLIKELEFFIKNKICKNGRASICKSCQAQYSRKWKKQNKVRLAKRRRELYYNSFGKSSKLRIEERKRIREQNQPFIVRARIMRAGMLNRSKKLCMKCDDKLYTVPFLVNWIKNQPNCICCNVILDISFKYDNKPNNRSPSLDRFDIKKGYVKNNVFLICWRCNNLKRDATIQELEVILNYMKIWGNDEKLKLQPLEVYNEG